MMRAGQSYGSPRRVSIEPDGIVGGGKLHGFRRSAGMSPRILPVFCALLVGLWATAASAQLTGYDDKLGVAPGGVLSDIDPNSGLTSVPPDFDSCVFNPTHLLVTPPFFFPIGFTSGMTRIGDTLYALEWENSDIYLYTIGVSSMFGGCAIGIRVGAQPVGFSELESLVFVPTDGPSGTLYSVDFEFSPVPPHQGQLIQIDPNTGVGAVVGPHMSNDVRIGGLAYDPTADVLYALGLGFATRSPELLTIDRSTGLETAIGLLGADGLESLAFDASVSPARLYAAGTELYELDPNAGAATLIGGDFSGTMWAMSDSRLADDPCAGKGGDADGDTLCDDEDPCKSFANTLPLVISNFSGIPDECLCGDFDGDGFHSATDAAAVNDCAAFLRFDCVSERDEVAPPIDGFYSATDADLINRVSSFLDPAYALKCGRRPEGTCGGDTGVACF